MQDSPQAPVIDNHVYIMPFKMVKTLDDMKNWENSEAYYEYLGFIFTLNDNIKGKSNEEGSYFATPDIDRMCNVLDILSNWIDEIPVNDNQKSRNRAFREWYGKLREEAISLIQSALPESLYRAVPEIMVYLIEGFGNSTRVDYGTGHELSFLMFLCCLFKIGHLKAYDGPAAACKLFVRYLDVVRKLQQTYQMKCAGSFGVWSLDDYQFVPFIWGSSQLIGNPDYDPTSFLKEHIVKSNASENMFFSCIDYINQIKTGPFAEHSNQLWSVSGVSSWSKVNSGLIRMYRAEVLSQFSLIKNVYFGSIFTLNPVEQGASVRRPRISITNIHKTSAVEWGDLRTRKTTMSLHSDSEKFRPSYDFYKRYKDDIRHTSSSLDQVRVGGVEEKPSKHSKSEADVDGPRTFKNEHKSIDSERHRTDPVLSELHVESPTEKPFKEKRTTIEIPNIGNEDEEHKDKSQSDKKLSIAVSEEEKKCPEDAQNLKNIVDVMTTEPGSNRNSIKVEKPRTSATFSVGKVSLQIPEMKKDSLVQSRTGSLRGSVTLPTKGTHPPSLFSNDSETDDQYY